MRIMVGDFPWDLYPMGGQQLITLTHTLQQEQVTHLRFCATLSWYEDLWYRSRSLYLYCLCSSWCAKETGSRSSGKYIYPFLFTFTCYRFSNSKISIICYRSQRVTIKWQRRTQ